MKFVLRSVRRSPAYSTLVILTVALAIGLVTAVLGSINAVFRPASPAQNPEQLFTVRQREEKLELLNGLRNRLPSVRDLALVQDAFTLVESSGTPSQHGVSFVEPRFFDVIGARASVGRTFLPIDEHASGLGVAVVSDRFWRQRIGASGRLSDQTITVNRRSYHVVGVAPPSLGELLSADVWLLTPREALLDQTSRPSSSVGAVVRLHPTAQREDLERELRDMSARLAGEREATGQVHFLVLPVAMAMPEFTELHGALLASTIAIVLIACANLANLSLARVLSRATTHAIVRALGASKRRILGAVVGESLMLSIVGGLVGVVLVVAVRAPLRRLIPTQVPYVGALDVRLDGVVAGGAILVAVLIAVAFSSWPAVRAASNSPIHALQHATGGKAHARRSLYGGLVVAQTALALGMATSAAFMMRATSRLASLEIGFNRAGLLEVQTTLLTEPHDSEIAARSFDEVLASVRSIPEVQGASWWSYVRVGGRYVEGYTEGGETHVLYNPRVLAVGADYLRVMGATMVKGRDFLPGDASGSPVAVIDERAARALFPYGSPIGRQVANIGVRGQSSFATVVGVVRTMRLSYSSFDVFDVGPGAVYVSTLPSPRMRTFLVRTTERALPNVMTKVVSRVETVAPNGTAVRAQRADWGKGRLEQGHEFLTHLFSAFALISLALSALGLYAILTYATIDRRREYAVRLSIGAAPREVFMRVLGEGFTLVLGGIALGEFVSFGASRLIDVFLLDLYHIDARTLVAADVMLLVVCVAAVLAPALRAMRTSPSELLRAQ